MSSLLRCAILRAKSRKYTAYAHWPYHGQNNLKHHAYFKQQNVPPVRSCWRSDVVKHDHSAHWQSSPSCCAPRAWCGDSPNRHGCAKCKTRTEKRLARIAFGCTALRVSKGALGMAAVKVLLQVMMWQGEHPACPICANKIVIDYKV